MLKDLLKDLVITGRRACQHGLIRGPVCCLFKGGSSVTMAACSGKLRH